MFDIFVEMHDCFLHYAESYVGHRAIPRRQRSAPISNATPEVAGAAAGHEVERAEPMVAYHTDIRRVLLDRKARTAEHPFYAWLREASSVSPKQKLQRFIPMWIGDIMGYRDLNKYAIRYPAVRSGQEAVINEWCDDLETHNILFLNDWDELKMDQALGWTASDTLKFCFLDPQMDVHRRNMCTFVKLAMGMKSPRCASGCSRRSRRVATPSSRTPRG